MQRKGGVSERATESACIGKVGIRKCIGKLVGIRTWLSRGLRTHPRPCGVAVGPHLFIKGVPHALPAGTPARHSLPEALTDSCLRLNP